jgi:hypothetical protein
MAIILVSEMGSILPDKALSALPRFIAYIIPGEEICMRVVVRVVW